MKKLHALIGLSALGLSVSVAATAATAPPKVVFFGDYVTYAWGSAFTANPNWVNQGDPAPNFGAEYASNLLARFQADVVSLHPAIVHIMIGSADGGFVSDESALFNSEEFLSDLNTMVTEAKAAKIQVILGLTPPGNTLDPGGYLSQINAAVAGYAATNNIPLVDYADAICGCASLNVPNTSLLALYTATQLMTTPAGTGLPFQFNLIPSTAGYALMTQLAENAVATLNLTLKSGWLQDVELPNETLSGSGVNVNTVSPPATLQFTPIGYYSDGSQHSLLNPNLQGATGTWTSSNPVVMNVNQDGLAWALSNGTTIIRYTSPGGVKFSEWVTYVKAPTF